MKRIATVFLLMAGLIIAASCDSPTDSKLEPIFVTGTVISGETGEPIGNAIVRKFAPAPEVFSVTDSQGRYELELDADTTYTASLEARKEGFPVLFLDLLIIPGRNIELDPIVFGDVTEDPGDGEGDNGDEEEDEGEEDEPTGPPSNIVLLEASETSISVAGTGGNENADFKFEVRDASGRAVDLENQIEVRFSFGGRPDGGEFLSPLETLTTEDGIAVTSLTSGTVSGVTQVKAEFTREDGATIRSTPVAISIQSGLPDLDHFAVAPEILNIPGNILNSQNGISALVGDKYGNMVQEGTIVYFTTSGGVIQSSAPTNELGNANVTLVSGSPFPVHQVLGPGFATIRARTADDNDQTIETNTIVLFSLGPTISATPDQVNIENGGSQTFTYTVADINGNPMVSGTSINVTVEGDNLDVIGDVNITMPDTQGRGPGFTEFQFTLTDSDPEEEEVKPVQITIEVTGPNGTAKHTITGTTKLF